MAVGATGRAETPTAGPAAGEDVPAGLHLGIRVGYLVPANGESFDLHGAVPFSLEAGWRFGRILTVSGLFDYGRLIPKQDAATACGMLYSCSGSVTRLGAAVLLHVRRYSARIHPWISGGFGYEWLHKDFFNNSLTFRGWEQFAVFIGVDVRIVRRCALGPFIGSVTSFYDVATEDGFTEDLGDHSHNQEWWQLGVRGSFDL